MINQRLLFSLAVIGLGSIIIFISVIRNTRPQTTLDFAVNQNEQVVSQLLQQESTGSSSLYASLPSPGILPDNPLYWLKMVRDRIDLLTTPNPIAKSDLMILYANKRLHSGIILLNKGLEGLGVTTITKAEKYLEQASHYIKSQNDGSLDERFKNTLTIHQHVLKDLIENSSITDKSVLEKMRYLNSSILEKYQSSTSSAQLQSKPSAVNLL